MPRTSRPQFNLGDITAVFTELWAAMPPQRGRGQNATAPDSATAPAAARGRGRSGPPPSPLQQCVARGSMPIGAHQTSAADSTHIQSSVDELYRLALAGERAPTPGIDTSKGWKVDSYKRVAGQAADARAG